MSSRYSTRWSPTSNAHGAAAVAAAKAEAAKEALQQLHDERVPEYYAFSMAGLILIFAIFHWCRILYNRRSSRKLKGSDVRYCQIGIARTLRRTLNRPLPGFTSVGHAVSILIYFAINISLTVTNVDWSFLGIAKRCGWMAITNIAFITFLALKNTPLAYLTAYSYERLNLLHQIAGYTTITYVFLHVTLMAKTFTKMNATSIFKELPQIHAMIAASAVFVILVTATIVRKMRYEVFYVTHITTYVLILINVGFHRPDFALKTVIVTIFAASIWSADRILRLCRILWYSYHNTASITPLSNGGTRIVLRRSPSRAVPGTHCFLWIPAIRAIETHPFTIVAATAFSLELVVASYNGFTKDLHKYAKQHPGATLRASIDGPYGGIPDLSRDADKVVLIAGGSGASFTFGLALDMIKKLGDSRKSTIDFIWAVKEQDSLSWFSKELSELQSSPLVNISLHVSSTRSSYSNALPSPYCTASPTPSSPSSDPEKNLPVTHTTPTQIPTSPFSPLDIEKRLSSTVNDAWVSTSTLNIISGRPDVENVVRSVVRNADVTERVAIAACGPEGLMRAVRRTAADCITVKGPSVELHCEQFGW